jgi:hypothetical protein
VVCRVRDAARWQADGARAELAAFYKRNVYCPVFAPDLAELTGPVERIDDPQAFLIKASRLTGALFGEHGVIRELSRQQRDEQLVRTPVALEPNVLCSHTFSESTPDLEEEHARRFRQGAPGAVVIPAAPAVAALGTRRLQVYSFSADMIG